ncbi:lipopolysaccharide biosynthesis protein [Clostridium estertheticum]|uniref:lipopolysaccharide biosynthesis protein n=1 Tax=Clostridium estertheticum TaxID=238834 RepID=UPI001C7CB4D9|nr:oligosaccharide flippase family protein [Clostridium estertheticum]MBX4270557.1 oligosaccharide flippase family protein [Clostridium estertheticum]WLC80082.1 oligosaccharide flippase family protein [Clostridium estertheticum]
MKHKQFLINIVAKIIAFTVSLGISFFLTPFLVKSVGKEAYGFVGLANDFVNYALIVTMALNSMAGRFITISLYEKNDESVNKYFTSVIVANVVITSIMIIPSIFIVLFINKIVHVPSNILIDVQLLWGFIFLNLLISIIGSVFGVAAFSKNRLDLESKRTIESNILKVVVLLIAFYFFRPSVWYIGLASTLCTIYIIFVNIYYTKKLLPQVHLDKKYFDLRSIKVLILSGVWNSVSQLSEILSSGLDLLVANIFIGASAMGVLSIAKTIPTMVLAVFAMLASIFAPQLTISYAQKDFNAIRRQLLISMKLLGILSCIPMAILFAYGDSFYRLWIPDQNAQLLQILSIIICFGLVFALPLEGLWNVFTATNKVKQSSVFLLCSSIISIGFTFIGIILTKDETVKLFIISGTSSVIGCFRALTFLPMYGAKCLKLKITTFYPVIAKNAISVAILTCISFLIKKSFTIDSWKKLFLVCLLTATIGILINVFLILSKEERNKFKGMISKRLIFLNRR